MKIIYLAFLTKYEKYLGEYKGLNEKEIQTLEKEFSVELPPIYKEFLYCFGSKSGQLLSSYLTNASKLKENRESAVYASFDELSGAKVAIKESYFFFGQWQGYVFYFFDCAEGKDDPPVYILTDSPEIKLYKPSFSVFLQEEGLEPLLKTYKQY